MGMEKKPEKLNVRIVLVDQDNNIDIPDTASVMKNVF